jgi:predicted Rossmann fold nucleotide-binding protein DprA/Smf involved in DNA uptake
MVENTELLIAFVEEGRKGGALTTLKYAEKQGVEIINLAICDE